MNRLLRIKFALILTLGACNTFAQSQSPIGFWAIEKVSIGDQAMTPIAKWSKIHADGTYESGNGWLQSARGTWQFDPKTHVFSANDPLDVADEFGGFTVSFEGDKMYWEREEEGMPVKVTLKPIDKLPMSPADYLEGIWDLEEITENGASILADYDPNNKRKIFMGWDRIYRDFDAEGRRSSGFWHIDGHRPEITLLPHQQGKSPEGWRIEVNEKTLTMTGISDSNQDIQKKYIRRNTF